MRIGKIAFAHLDAETLESIIRLSEAGSIDEPQGPFSAVDHCFERIPRRTRYFGHYRPGPSQQRVEERRLAGIGRTRNNDDSAFPNELTSWSSSQQVFERCHNCHRGFF